MSDETAAATVRRIVRTIDRAALGTRLRDAEGAPYVSLVLAATDLAGHPLLHLSDLADHTRNLLADDRASLLFDATGERDDVLAGERATLVGRLMPTDDPADRERYLRRHPGAQMYAGFADFRFRRFVPERAHLVAGFGRIHWLDGSEIIARRANALEEAEAGIIEHMNEDHRDALQLYATVLLDRRGNGWIATGIDPDGLDLRAGGRTARIAFSRRIEDATAARAELVRLVKEARRKATP
jgi:putative heme iron utilization protein